MGRTIHYKIMEDISDGKIEKIQREIEKINKKENWEFEKLKLLNKGSPFENDNVWGFIKIRENEEIKVVLDYLKSISSKFPKITLVISVEGDPVQSKIRNGEVIKIM